MIADRLRLALLFLRGRRPRLALVAFALALGVAAVCAVDILNRAVLRAFVDVIGTMAGRAELQVGAGAAGLFREGVVHRVGRMAGVAAAIPVMSATAFLPGDPAPLTVYGVDMLSEAPARAFGVEVPLPTPGELTQGFEPRTVFLSTPLAARLGRRAGDTLALETPAGRREYTVRSVVDLGTLGEGVGADLVVMHLPGAQLDFGRLRLVNRGDVVLADGADLERVRAEIARALPPGLEVTTPLQRTMDLRRVMRAFQIILWGVALVALLLGVLVAFDALATHFEAHAWQAGVLRAVGLRTATVWRELLKQALLLGVAGVGAGVPAGIALGRALVPLVNVTAAVHANVTAPPAAADVSPWSLALAAAAGLAAALAAAALPAWRAARVPIAATVRLRGREASRTPGARPGRLRAAVVAGAAAAAAVAGGSTAAGLAATGLVLAATALAARPLLAALLPALQRLLQRLPDPAAPFAVAGLAQGLRRTALAVAVIAVGAGSVLWMRTVSGSFERSLADALGGSLRADLVVTTTRMASGWIPAPVSGDVVADVAAVPGVRRVAGNRLADVPFRGVTVAINAFDRAYFAADEFEKPPLVGERLPDAWEAVGRGEAVVVSTNFLLNFGARVGDVVELATPSGLLALPIAGATLAFVSPGGTIEMSRERWREHWRDALVNRIWVDTAPGADPTAVRAAIAGAGAAHGLRAVSAREMREHLIAQARRAFAPMAVVEAVVLLVVLVSLADTLAASVLGRLREIGTLRAVGARPRHVVRIVVAEGLLIGVAGVALAAVAGLALGALWVHRVLPHLLGWLLALHPPVGRLAAVTAALAAVCCLAAILPARRAARLEPAMALRYE